MGLLGFWCYDTLIHPNHTIPLKNTKYLVLYLVFNKGIVNKTFSVNKTLHVGSLSQLSIQLLIYVVNQLFSYLVTTNKKAYPLIKNNVKGNVVRTNVYHKYIKDLKFNITIDLDGFIY